MVTQARQILRAESQSAIVYHTLQEQARSLPEYRLSQFIGPQGAALTGTDYSIPGFYTQHGFQLFLVAQGPKQVNEILQDNWVLGESTGISGMDFPITVKEISYIA